MTSLDYSNRWLPKLKDYAETKTTDPELTLNQFCKQRGFSSCSLYRAAKRLDFDVLQEEKPKPNSKLVQTSVQLARLEGHLLGDGCLFYTHLGKNKMPVFSFTSKYEEYTNWVVSTLEIAKQRPVWEAHVTDKRTGKQSDAWWFRSLSSEFLADMHARWYPAGRKCIPVDLEVSSELLLRWFLDDGSKATSGGLNLATNCFSLSEVELLCERLNGLSLNARPHKNDGAYRIYFPARDVKRFQELIGPCPVRCFNYKWYM